MSADDQRIYEPETPLYTDGSPVREGDRIRYHQAPGGLLPPPSDAHGNVLWTTGTAVHDSMLSVPPELRRKAELAGNPYQELVLRTEEGRKYMITGGHIIERVGE